MAAATLFAQPFHYQPDTREDSETPGAPLVGAQIYVYVAGTSTPTPVYADVDLSVEWAQPIVTNAAGQSDGPIYVTPTPSLKILIQDADNVDLPGYPMDNWTPYALES